MSAIFALHWLDQRFLHPRLEEVSPDWLRLGLEMSLLLLDHVVGAVGALLVCSHVFGFEVVPGAAWVVVAAMVIAFPIIHGTEMALRFLRQVQEKERQEERLNGSERGLVPLEEEPGFLDDYLGIERVRFGNRLHVTREAEPEVLGLLVPSLVLQPLVENTVRHGQGADGSIDLGIAVHTDGDRAVIVISDQGPGLLARHKIGEGPGHGLYNIDQRLRKTYGKAYGLRISANQPQGTVVTLSIPVGQGDRGSCEP